MSLRMITLAFAMAFATPVAAQDSFNPNDPRAASGHMDPTAMLLQTICVPWIGGVDSARMVEVLRKRGYAVMVDGVRPQKINPPDTIKLSGWNAVLPGLDRKSCTINIIWVASSPLDYIAADVQFWLKERAPGGPFKPNPAKQKDGEWGKAERVRAWESPTYEVTIIERPDKMLSEVEGKPVVELDVYFRKKS